MKKLTLLAATALTMTGLAGQTITAQAATKSNVQYLSNNNGLVIAYGSGCNVEDILGQLGNCFPNISFPNCEIPGENTPGNGSTEDTAPENTPENDSTEENAPVGEHAFIKEVVDLVNIERAKEGLSPLSINTGVQAAAMVRAKECEQLFSHTRPDGSSFSTALKEQNISYKSTGENIAWGQKSPKEVMNAWMNSSGHRANIMNPNFTTIGVGYYENANGTDYWCQLFTR